MIYNSKKKRVFSLLAAISLSATIVMSAVACATTPSTTSSVHSEANRAAARAKEPSYSDIKVEDGMQTYYQLPSVEKGKFDEYYTNMWYFPNSGAHRETTNNYRPFEETEWGVTYKTEPRFEGHHQPNVPVWGYTNCSDPAVMSKEIEVMAEYGVDCVTFDWYWVKERRLNKTGMRKDGTDGMYFSEELEYGYLRSENRDVVDFAIMWCNEAPSAGGADSNQDKEEWDIMTDYIIENYFSLPNYSRYNGKLVFTIYSMTNFVSQIRGEYGQTDVRLVKEALDEFRQKTRAAGLGELYIQAIENRTSMVDDSVFNILTSGGTITGADGTVYSWSNWNQYTACKYVGVDSCAIFGMPSTDVKTQPVKFYNKEDNGRVIDMADIVDAAFRVFNEKGFSKEGAKYNSWGQVGIEYNTGFYPGVDHTPRVGNGNVWNVDLGYPHGSVVINSNPYNYQQGLLECRKLVDANNINRVNLGSWNEWGEGGFIKPDTLYGYGKLRAIKNVFGA